VFAGSGLSPADAAILSGAESALTPPAGTILHVTATVTVAGTASGPYELWAQADQPQGWRVLKFGHEAAWNGTTFSEFDASTNTIHESSADQSHQPSDIAASLRSLIASGQAQVTGTTVYGSTPAYTLTVSGLPAGWSNGVADGTYVVAQSDDRPLEVQTAVECGNGATCAETVVFTTYEYLPASPSNTALLDLAAQHPGAQVVDNDGAQTSPARQASKS
jgi:hypothetical protein